MVDQPPLRDINRDIMLLINDVLAPRDRGDHRIGNALSVAYQRLTEQKFTEAFEPLSDVLEELEDSNPYELLLTLRRLLLNRQQQGENLQPFEDFITEQSQRTIPGFEVLAERRRSRMLRESGNSYENSPSQFSPAELNAQGTEQQPFEFTFNPDDPGALRAFNKFLKRVSYLSLRKMLDTAMIHVVLPNNQKVRIIAEPIDQVFHILDDSQDNNVSQQLSKTLSRNIEVERFPGKFDVRKKSILTTENLPAVHLESKNIIQAGGDIRGSGEREEPYQENSNNEYTTIAHGISASITNSKPVYINNRGMVFKIDASYNMITYVAGSPTDGEPDRQKAIDSVKKSFDSYTNYLSGRLQYLEQEKIREARSQDPLYDIKRLRPIRDGETDLQYEQTLQRINALKSRLSRSISPISLQQNEEYIRQAVKQVDDEAARRKELSPQEMAKKLKKMVLGILSRK